MKRSIFAIVLSMTAAILLVNASAEDLPIGNRPAPNTPQRTRKDQTPTLSPLIALLMKTGDDDQLPPTMSPLFGLSGTPFIKSHDFTLPRKEGSERRECAIVFAEDSNVQRPSCLYIQHKFVSGRDGESHYYRLNLEGKLEKATILRSKFDENGKPIVGSGVATDKDIDSPVVQKAFKAELAYWTKEWVNTQKKAQARAATASSNSTRH